MRTTPAIYLQQRVKVRTWIFYSKSSLDTNTHTHTVCLDNKSWEVLSDQWFLFIKREMICPGTCAVPFLCDFYMTFPMGPLAGSWSPCATQLNKNPRIAPGGSSISSRTPRVGMKAGKISVSALETLPSVSRSLWGQACRLLPNITAFKTFNTTGCCVNYICFPSWLTRKDISSVRSGESKIMFTCLLKDITCFRAGCFHPREIILNWLTIFPKRTNSRSNASLVMNDGTFESWF